VGQPAPDFALRDQHGREQTPASRRGTRNVLLVFYPFAFTGVCTGEVQRLNEQLEAFDELHTDVVAVSCDSVPALRAFADREGLALPLASDFWPHGEVSRAYDAFDPVLGCATRATFVIDRAGLVQWSVRSEISDARDTNDYLRALGDL
jgi:mycoredoxin-dependent peroxiredoxin